MQKLIIMGLVLITFCLGAAISYHNPQAVELNFLVGRSSLPLGALVVLIAAATICVMVLVYALATLPRRAQLARLRKRLVKAENELSNLRKLPLKDG